MTTEQKKRQEQGKAGQAGKWTASGFVPSNQQTKKSITLLDIILGKR